MLKSLAAAFALLMPFAALADVPTVKVQESSFAGIGYKIDGSGEISIFATPKQIGDKLAVCGVVVIEHASNTAKGLEKRFSRGTVFSISGQRLMASTDFFPRYDSMDKAKVGVAGCAVTNVPWDPAFAKTKLDLQLPPQTIHD